MLCTVGLAVAETPAVPDTYTAITTSMNPQDVEIKIAVREWSDDASRSAVVDVLAADANASQALAELPTVGYVWQKGSAAGHAVKYAYRASGERGQHVTFVTEKALDSYAFKPWSTNGAADVVKHDYSVIELYLNDAGTGTGTISLAANVELDNEHGVVSLDVEPGAPQLLANAKLEPKPYWAK